MSVAAIVTASTWYSAGSPKRATATPLTSGPTARPESTHVANAASRSTVVPDRSLAARTGPVVERRARASTIAIAAG
jgi:hypothetical protein